MNNEIEFLIKQIQNFELACDMRDLFDAGTVRGLQFARGRLTNLLSISKGEIKIAKMKTVI